MHKFLIACTAAFLFYSCSDKNEIKDPYIINEKLINNITTLIMIFKDLMTKEEKRDLDYLLRHERQEIIELFKDKKMILTDIGGMTD